MVKSLIDKKIYEFGEFRLDPAERMLLRSGASVQIPPKAFETLVVLVENKGRLVAKEELMKAVWPDSFVEESNLTLNIHTLRKLFNEGSTEAQSFIETVPKKGYRFTAEVREVVPIQTAAPILVEKHTVTHIVKEEEVGWREEERERGEREKGRKGGGVNF
jgi:DNA-binding winged helix-turn-helix (wHTH) protein